jgi:hypothetical protein
VNGKGATLIDQAQLNANEEAKWRAEFEKLGREAVRLGITRDQGFVPDRKRELALLWLREKEIEAEKRELELAWYAKWTWDAAFAAAILAAIGIALAFYQIVGAKQGVRVRLAARALPAIIRRHVHLDAERKALHQPWRRGRRDAPGNNIKSGHVCSVSALTVRLMRGAARCFATL